MKIEDLNEIINNRVKTLKKILKENENEFRGNLPI